MADLEQVVNDLNLASQSLQELREKYDGALDLLDNKNTEITGALDSAKSDALQEIQTISDTATSQISQLKDTSLNLVNEAKNTAIEEVNNAASGIDTSKKEALLEIEQAKAAQEEKITALEQAKENIITELSEKAKLLTQSLEWTVSDEPISNTNFQDLQLALYEAAKFKNYKNTNIKLVLNKNLNIPNGVAVIGLDLSYLTIDFNGFKLTSNDGYGIRIINSKLRNILSPYINSKYPCIACIECSNVFIGENSKKDKIKVKNTAANYGVFYSTQGSNISTTNGLAIEYEEATVDSRLMQSTYGANINASGIEVTMNAGTVLNVGFGGVINAGGINITGGATKSNQTPLQETINGLIRA
ncbi:hypothetical protein ACMTLN_001550 [Campylobacter coli]